MATNIDSNGNYPLSDKAWPLFETMWKEHLSFMPQVLLMDWKERENWKSFAKSVYDSLVKDDYVQSAVNEAFEDGYDDGVESARKGVNTLLDEASKKYPSSPVVEFCRQKITTI
jgi:hypothetical protein